MLSPSALLDRNSPSTSRGLTYYIYVVRRHLAPFFLQVEGLVVVRKYEAGAML